MIDALINEEVGAEESFGRFPPLRPKLAQGGADHDQDEQARDAQDDVADTHNERIGLAAFVAGQESEPQAEEGVAEEEGEDAEDQRRTGGEEGAAEQVAPVAVGAEEMVPGGALQVFRGA